jgi:hypothetical protein
MRFCLIILFSTLRGAERNRVLEDARALPQALSPSFSSGEQDLFTKTEAWFVCGDSPGVCGTSSDEPPERLLSAYRLGKNDRPVAIHPRRYYEKKERDEACWSPC